ncbi:MAG: hypothetical protein NVV63_01980 [Opitutus sp.]|nr:hypothetical protein [Opitutus sp.]
MRVLCWSDFPPEIHPVPRLGVEQVNCGPAYRDRIFGGFVLSLAAPFGEEALATVLSRLPSEQQPEMFVRIFDPRAPQPLRLPPSLTIPKVLVVGECVYPGTPIQAAISEAQSGGYDAIVYGGEKRDLAYFEAEGFRARWMPWRETTVENEGPLEFERALEFETWMSRGAEELVGAKRPIPLELTLCETVRSVRAESGRITFVCSANARAMRLAISLRNSRPKGLGVRERQCRRSFSRAYPR